MTGPGQACLRLQGGFFHINLWVSTVLVWPVQEGNACRTGVGEDKDCGQLCQEDHAWAANAVECSDLSWLVLADNAGRPGRERPDDRGRCNTFRHVRRDVAASRPDRAKRHHPSSTLGDCGYQK